MLFSRRSLRDVRVHYKTLAGHLSKVGHLAPVFADALKRIAAPDNIREHGIVIPGTHHDYFWFLDWALEHTRTSVDAILYEPYWPWWFFEVPDNPEDGSGNIPQVDGLAWIEKVGRKGGIASRRLLCFTNASSDPKHTFGSVCPTHAAGCKRFVDKCGNTDLWLLNAVELTNRRQYDTTLNTIASQCYDHVVTNGEDFAVFDHRIVIKYLPAWKRLHIVPVVDGSRYWQLHGTLFGGYKDELWSVFNHEFIDKLSS